MNAIIAMFGWTSLFAVASTSALAHLGIMRGQFQAIHLLAHIESARELTADQIESYARLRGYRH